MAEPPQNLEAERNILGSLMTTAAMLRPVLVDSGLKREHFHLERHGLIFAAIQELAANRSPTDSLSVCAHMNSTLQQAGGKEYVAHLPNEVPAPGNAVHYARLVIEAADAREKLAGAASVIEGVKTHTPELITDGIQRITSDIVAGQEPSDPEEIRSELLDYVDDPKTPEVFELPWGPLNDYLGAGGYLRGEFSLLAGWTSLGKSLALDQILAHFHSQGKRCHLFTTEMTRLERSMRYTTAVTKIPYRKLIRRELDDRERALVKESTVDFPFGIRSAEGWTVERICQEIAAREVDVAAIDPLNLIRFESGVGRSRTAWYDEVLERLKFTAIRANCHVIGVTQLNMARAKEENPPMPALRDIRDSGSAQYIASHILALHRTFKGGAPTKQGELKFLKVRNGIRDGSCEVTFNERTLRFDLRGKAAKPVQDEMKIKTGGLMDVDVFD